MDRSNLQDTESARTETLFSLSYTEQLCCPQAHLFFFGVQLEALIQGTAMLLQMLLLLVPHTLRILHHFLLDAAKQTVVHRDSYQQCLLSLFCCMIVFTVCKWLGVYVCCTQTLSVCVLGSKQIGKWDSEIYRGWQTVCDLTLFTAYMLIWCLPFFSLVIPLNDKFYMRRSSRATEL